MYDYFYSAWQTNQEITGRTTRRALEQVWEVASAPTQLNPFLSYTRLADLARANALLWTEAGLQIQERTVRGVPAGRAVSRPLVLAAVATDIFLGYMILNERARWFPTLTREQDRRWQDERGANRVLETATTLGGALIKACQFASTRPDLLPASYIRAMAPLQDRLPARPWPEIKRVIEGELGKPLESVFAEIEEEPVAAASISQVHRARLHDGHSVAVKVQYPDIRELVATDLSVLERLANVVAQIASDIRLQPIVDYLKETLPLELDFAREAEAMVKLSTALRHRADVVVPQVVAELSTARLIVMEYVEGVKITDTEAMQEAGINPREAAMLLNDLFADQILHLGILHADPHPGNLLVQPGPRLVLLDHGLTVPLEQPLVDSLRQMVQALVTGDFERLTRVLIDAGVQVDENVDLAELLGLVGVLLGNAPVEGSGEDAGAEVQGRSAGGVATGIRLGKSIGSIPVELLLVGRALGLLDGITRQLDPGINTLSIVATYA